MVIWDTKPNHCLSEYGFVVPLIKTKRGKKKMGNIKAEAEAYVPPQTLNITDLESVSVDIDLKEETFQDSEGKDFTVKTFEVGEEKYRCPISVLKQLKEHLAEKPTLKTFKVNKSGTGLGTEYTVIPLV